MHRENELKRKLRSLKRLEINLRFNGRPDPNLLWKHYFSDNPNESTCKHPFKKLLEDSNYRRLAMEDFITSLYYQYFRERGLLNTADPLSLAEFGLPPDAGPQDIKERFRTLVKKHHPDLGGDHEQMIELIKQYHKLLGID